MFLSKHALFVCAFLTTLVFAEEGSYHICYDGGTTKQSPYECHVNLDFTLESVYDCTSCFLSDGNGKSHELSQAFFTLKNCVDWDGVTPTPKFPPGEGKIVRPEAFALVIPPQEVDGQREFYGAKGVDVTAGVATETVGLYICRYANPSVFGCNGCILKAKTSRGVGPWYFNGTYQSVG